MTMQIIHTPPLDKYNDLSSGKLLKTLFEAGDWTIRQVADELFVTEDSVKSWLYRGVSPRGENRYKLIRMIYQFSSEDEIAQEWVRALEKSWMQGRIKHNPKGIEKDINIEENINNEKDINKNAIKHGQNGMDEETQKRLKTLLYLAASFLFVLVVVNAYSKGTNLFYSMLQSMLIVATVAPLTCMLWLAAINKLQTIVIWFSLKTFVLGSLLIIYFDFFPNEALHGRLAASMVILPLVLLMFYNATYLILYTLRMVLYRLDHKHRIMRTLMRPFIRYRKNFMRLLELRWLFPVASFAILAVANLTLLLPGLGFIMK